MIKEFKPALFFLAKFIGIYVVGNVLYGLYIESYGDRVDPATEWVAHQTSGVLHLFGEDTNVASMPDTPTVGLNGRKESGLTFYEGCNGINVMIVFVSFMVAFSGPWRKLTVYILLGLISIHVANLIRLAMLFLVTLHWEHYFYYFHKYLFTAIIYSFVFGLWALWIWRFSSVPDVVKE